MAGDKAKNPKGKSKGKLIGIILGVVILLGGTVVGLGVTGILKIPGLTPRKKLAPSQYADHAAKLYGDAKEKSPEPTKEVAKAPEPTPEEPKKETPLDLAKGAEALAEVWNSVPNDRLIGITDKWSTQDLARVFAKMETEKVAALLAAMPPARASEISQEMRDQASIAIKS